MKTIENIDAFLSYRASFSGKSIGFVPTMGALHAGHASLLQRARLENDLLVLSIFVNPTQFNDPNDFKKYPKTLEADLKIAEKEKVDVVFLPQYNELYADSYRYQVTEAQQSQKLCGAHRAGHFQGVLTVVLKLLQIVSADRAYFGEKDYQQFLLISEMAKSFFLKTEIIPCPTVRDRDGLALSSRNALLTERGRERAAFFPKILNSAFSPAQVRAELEALGFGVDYVEDLWGRRFGAIQIEGIRLIDNFKLSEFADG